MPIGCRPISWSRTKRTASSPRRFGNCRKARSVPSPGSTPSCMHRKLKDGELNCLLGAVQQQPAGFRQHERGGLSGLAQSGQLHRDRLRPLSDGFGPGRRPRCCRPPCGPRRKAPMATPNGAPSSGASRSRLRAKSRSDVWQTIEFSKYFKVEEVWPEDLIAKKPEYRGKTLYDVLCSPTASSNKFENTEIEDARRQRLRQRRERVFRLLPAERPVRGIQAVQLGRGDSEEGATTWRPMTMYHKAPRPALAGHRRQGDALPVPRRLRPACREG